MSFSFRSVRRLIFRFQVPVFISALLGFLISFSEWLEWAYATAFLPVYEACRLVFGRGCMAPPVEAWRQLLGIPLPLLGMANFAGILLMWTLWLLRRKDWAIRFWAFTGFLGNVGALLFVYAGTRMLNEFTLLGTLFSGAVLVFLLPGFSFRRYVKEAFEFFRGPDLSAALLLFALVLVALLIATARFGVQREEALSLKDPSLPELYDAWTAEKKILNEGLPEGGIELGLPHDARTPVEVVEFVDLECQPCLESLSAALPFPKDLKNRVRYTLLQFPLSSECNPMVSGRPHPRSCEYSELLLGEKRTGDLSPLLERRVRYPLERSDRVLGPKKPFHSNSTEALLLNQHLALGKKLGIQGTPAVYLNGKKIGPFKNPATLIAFTRYVLGRDFSEEPATGRTLGAFSTVPLPFLGKADAPIEIYEFSSFQCPHSQKMNAILNLLVDSGKVKVAYKPLPLEPSEAYEFQARFILALGAAWQGKTGKEKERYAAAFRFFKTDLYRFMKDTSSDKIKKSVSADLKRLGIDDQEIKDLFNAASVKEAFAKNLADGKRLGITQYPVLFVNGHYYQGPPDPAQILAAGK